jgi:Tripartite tricarboxylate transporter TctB family
MSLKKATNISLFLILLFAIGYYIGTNTLPEANDSVSLGPRYFPTLLVILLVLLCSISFFQTRKKEDEIIHIANIRLILITIGLTILFFISWSLIGYFYINSFIFLLLLFTSYTWKQLKSKKRIYRHSLIASLITLSIYLFFDLLLGIKF